MYAPRWILASILALVPAFATESVAQAATASSVAEDLQEWRTAWSALTQEERDTLTTAWFNAIDAVASLTPEQKTQIRNAARDFTIALTAWVASLSPEQKDVLAEKLESLRSAYKALTAEQKQEFLSKASKAIKRSKVRRAKRQAFRAELTALVG